MSANDAEHVLSPLDQAHAHHLAGEDEPALRMAIACAKAASGEPGPIALVARILVDGEHTIVAGEVAVRLVDAFIRRGDLAQAVVAANIALDAGEGFDPHLETIAAAFGKGSPRLGAGFVKPPPFPKPPPVPPALANARGPKLYEFADNLLTAYLSSDDSVAADSKLPELPLFSSLEPDVLARLLGAVRVEEVSGGNEVVPQGEEGHEAFVLARGLLRVVRHQGADKTVLAQLGPGAIFGEMALVSASPRSAAVVAMEPAQLLVLARDELERLAPEAPALGQQLAAFCRGRMESNLIRHARVLKAVPTGERQDLLHHFTSKMFDAGDTLISRGQDPECAYLIASGCVSVSVPEGDDRLVLATLMPGDVVGEISLILRREATADVVALHPTVAIEITADKLRQVMHDHPGLLVELYDLATRREEETRSLVDEDEVLDADDVILV